MIDRIQDVFAALEENLFLACAGAPLSNGITAARMKAALVVFEIVEEIDEKAQEALKALRVFNITKRQALHSVNRRCGYFVDPQRPRSEARHEAMEYLRKLIRTEQDRLNLLASLNLNKMTGADASTSQTSYRNTGTMLLYVPSVLAAFETVYSILAHRNISPLDIGNAGYIWPTVTGKDSNGTGRLAVTSSQPIRDYETAIKTVCYHCPEFCIDDNAFEICEDREEFKEIRESVMSPMAIWSRLFIQYGESQQLSARAAEAGHLHAEALHMCDITVLSHYFGTH